MATITRGTAFVSGTNAVAADVNSEFDKVYDEFNGNIDNANIKAAAAIAWTKLSKSGSLLSDIGAAWGTITVDTPAINATQTWNASAITFQFIKCNITDTASAAASTLLDLQVGGSSKFKVDKTGLLTLANVSHVFAGTITGTYTLSSPVLSGTLTGTYTLGGTPTITAPDINGGTADSLTSLSIRSTGAAFDLTLATATVFTAGRTLTINPGDAARTITLSGNPTLADWFDQAVKTTSNPTFGNLTITSFAANWTNASRTIADLGTVTTADINGGTIDGVTITSPTLAGTAIGTYIIGGTPTLGAALAMSGAPNLGTAAAPAGTGFFTLLDLEPVSSTAGIIRWNGVNVLHIYGGGLNEESVFFGPRAGNFTITGNEAVGIGRDALAALTSGQQNVAVGSGAGIAITSGSSNVVVGSQALASLTTSGGNVAIGQNALNVTTGGKNVAVGTSAGLSLDTGSTNVLVGEQAGHQIDGGSRTGNFSGSNNVGVGYLTLGHLTTGSDNNAIGSSALNDVTSGGSNTAIAGLANLTTGSSNRFLGGSNALTSGNYNSGIGEEVLNGLTSGSNNIAMGYRAGGGGATTGRITTGTYNIMIGDTTEFTDATQLDKTIVIGVNGRAYQSNTAALGGPGADAVSFWLHKKSAITVAPGANIAALQWETGTNAGTLKLVAYAGTSTTGVTVVDNVGTGSS